MSYEIEQHLIQRDFSDCWANLFVILHETGNSKSTWQNEVDNMHNNWAKQTAYATCIVGGGGKVAQIAPSGKQSWAALDANPYSPVQIELSHAHDKATFDKDYAAYIELARDSAMKFGIPLTLDAGGAGNPGIKSHAWCTDNYPSRGLADHRDPYSYFASWGISKDKLAYDLAHGVSSAVTMPQNQDNIGSGALRVAIINYATGYGINAFDKNGKMIVGTNTKFTSGTSWQVFEIKDKMYRVSSTEWLPKEYIYDVHYVAQNKTGYEVLLMSKPIWEQQYKVGKIGDNNMYMVQFTKRVGTDLWLNFGGNQWSLARYFNIYVGTK